AAAGAQEALTQLEKSWREHGRIAQKALMSLKRIWKAHGLSEKAIHEVIPSHPRKRKPATRGEPTPQTPALPTPPAATPDVPAATAASPAATPEPPAATPAVAEPAMPVASAPAGELPPS